MLLSLGHLIVDMHSGALPIIFTVLQDTYALTYAQIGALMLVSQIASSVIQPAFGFISDRVSTRWLLPVSLLVTTAAFVLIGVMGSYAAVTVVVIILGLGIAAYHPEASKVVYHVGGTSKGRAMSVFALGGNVGLALGPILIAFGLSLFGMGGTLLFVPITVVTALLFYRSLDRLYAGWITSPPSETGDHQQERAIEQDARPDANLDRSDTMQDRSDAMLGVSPGTASSTVEKRESQVHSHGRAGRIGAVALLLVVIFLRSGAHTSLITFVPLYYTNELGQTTSYGSLVLTAFLVAGAIGTALGGVIADRLGSFWVIAGSMLVSAPFTALIPFTASGSFPIILLAIIGLFLVSSWAVTTVMGQRLLPDNVGLASGLTLGFSVGTGGLSVTALGWVGDLLGIRFVFLLVAMIAALGGLLALRLPRKDELSPQALVEENAA